MHLISRICDEIKRRALSREHGPSDLFAPRRGVVARIKFGRDQEGCLERHDEVARISRGGRVGLDSSSMPSPKCTRVIPVFVCCSGSVGVIADRDGLNVLICAYEIEPKAAEARLSCIYGFRLPSTSTAPSADNSLRSTLISRNPVWCRNSPGGPP